VEFSLSKDYYFRRFDVTPKHRIQFGPAGGECFRAHTDFQKSFSMLFDTKYNLTTITYLHFSKICFIELNVKNISSKEQNLNKQMAEFRIAMPFQYLCTFWPNSDFTIQYFFNISTVW